MNQKFNLTIKNPCSEKFDDFQPTKAGGFCNACQKEVIDFTQMSEKEIVAYFKNHNGKTCGRFFRGQLRTYNENNPTQRQRKSHLLGAGLFSFSLFSLLTIGSSRAQEFNSIHTVQVSQKTNNNAQNPTSNPDNNDHIIQGIVFENKTPMPGISVYIKGTNKGTITDNDGKFKLDGAKTGDVILFSWLGYETKTYKIKENAPEIIYIEMKFKESDIIWMGEVVTNEIYASKRTFWQKLKGLFR